MKSSRIFILCILLFITGMFFWRDGGREEYATVQIFASLGDESSVVGMGVRDGDMILTSAHVLSDDRYKYSFEWEGQKYPLSLAAKDEMRDIAYLANFRMGKELSGYTLKKQMSFISKRNMLKVGDEVYAIVNRSGTIIRLNGKVMSPQGKVLGYTSAGQMRMLSGIVVTGIPAQQGDSGAPIYDKEGDLIDVVHVMAK